MAVNEEVNKKEGIGAASATAEEAAPAAPAGPEIKLSQIVPMLAMLALQKFDIEQLGYTRHVEIGYVVVQVVCLAVLYLVYQKIDAMEDDGVKIKIPAVKQFGQEVTPAKEQTTREYDMAQWKESVKQPVIGCVILGGIYYKWGSIMPLVLQVLMTPMQLYEAPLTQIHLLGKKKTRPFPTPNPFGLPETPQPAAEQVEETDEKKELTAGDAVEATATFKSDGKDKTVIPEGARGKIIKLDEDGDANVDFEHHDSRLWVKKSNFAHLKKQDKEQTKKDSKKTK